MTRPILASAAAAALALTTFAAAPAEARSRGGAVAAGAIIGLAAGAIIGSAIAGRDDTVTTYHPDYARPAYAGPRYYAPHRPYARHRVVEEPGYHYAPAHRYRYRDYDSW